MLKTRRMRQCGYAGISFSIILCKFAGDIVQSGNFVVFLCRVCVGCVGSGRTQLRSHNGRLVSPYNHSASLMKPLFRCKS